MISEAEAREIAGEWHGGQWSPLYAFCSSGTMVEGLEGEIADCLRVVYPHSAEDIARLRSLKEYVDEHATQS